MGRRSIQPPAAARLAGAQHTIRNAALLGSALEIEIARRALRAPGVVEAIMLDTAAPAAIRLEAARELLDRSVGKPAIRADVTATMRVDGNHDATLEQIERIQREAAVLMELDDLVRRQVPFHLWPPAVREAAGDTGPLLVEAEAESA